MDNRIKRDSNRGSRRRLLRTLCTAAVAGLAGCNTGNTDTGTSTTSTATRTRTGTPTSTAEPAETTQEWELDPVEHGKLIGAHYYVWYNSDPGWEDWLQTVPAQPVLGEYSSAAEEIIDQHIKWARDHGINWFDISWWGPDSDEDRVLNDHFLEAQLADHIQFSILYESGGRLELTPSGRFDMDLENNRRRLRQDFLYLEDTYFERPTYLTIHDRPVVFFYRAPQLIGDAKTALREATAAIDSDPYLIADVVTDGAAFLQADWMDTFDAASTYNVYSPGDVVTLEDGRFEPFAELTTKKTTDWYLTADRADIDFIPNIIPGFNDGSDGNKPILRRDSEVFPTFAGDIGDRMDPELDAVLVTSANEWGEYTAIFPTESYGEEYLDATERELAQGEPSYVDRARYDEILLDFNKAIRPVEANPESTDIRALSVMAGAFELLDSAGETISTSDLGIPGEEPFFGGGTYPPAHGDARFDHWRWLGGEDAWSAIYIDAGLKDVAEATLVASPIRKNEIEAAVYVNGQQTDRIAFGDYPAQSYTISLGP